MRLIALASLLLLASPALPAAEDDLPGKLVAEILIRCKELARDRGDDRCSLISRDALAAMREEKDLAKLLDEKGATQKAKVQCEAQCEAQRTH